jgi:hypothetical protein
MHSTTRSTSVTSWAVQALMADPTLGGLAENIQEVNTNWVAAEANRLRRRPARLRRHVSDTRGRSRHHRLIERRDRSRATLSRLARTLPCQRSSRSLVAPDRPRPRPVYFNPQDPTTGVLKGFFPFGNAKKLSITTTPNTTQVKDYTSGVLGALRRVHHQTDLALAIEMYEQSEDNVALATLGDRTTLTQAAATVTAETRRRDARRHQGPRVLDAKRSISAIVVKQGATTLVARHGLRRRGCGELGAHPPARDERDDRRRHERHDRLHRGRAHGRCVATSPWCAARRRAASRAR